MDLPAEIIFQVASYFVEPKRTKIFRSMFGTIDAIWSPFITCCPRTDSGGHEEPAFYNQVLDKPTIFALRLVSKAWHSVATTLLRDHQWWNIHLDFQRRLNVALNAATSPLPSTSSALGPRPVKKLEIPEIFSLIKWSRFFFLDYLPPNWEEMEQVEGRVHETRVAEGQDVSQQLSYSLFYRDKSDTTPYDPSADLQLLNRIIDRLDAVEAFRLTFPLPSSSCDDYHPPCVHWYNMLALYEICTTICHGLRSAAFSHLSDLRLGVPSTHYVGMLTSAMDDDARAHIRHLLLCIVDGTGRNASFVFEPGDYSVASPSDGSVRYHPHSAVQTAYPNQAYQDDLWSFVASCPNLESLGISATNFLDLRRLRWRKSPLSSGLRVLSLSCIYATVTDLMDLITPHPESGALAPQLRRLHLSEVRIKPDGGDWADVFTYLQTTCSSLEYAFLHELSYFTAHRHYHADHYYHSDRCREVEIHTGHAKDQKALHNLEKSLVTSGGGFNERGRFAISYPSY